MESLNDTKWDVVISGTGLPQSLLALALSRSDKKILHVDCNSYYGGHEAALSLSEAEAWAQEHAASDRLISFSHASVSKAASDEDSGQTKLLSARAYALALAPQLLYTRSALLPALVSSRTDNQLDFQAVGSWFIVDTPTEEAESQAKITKVPGGREDIFSDGTLDLKAKRNLMKLLRFVGNYEEQDTWHANRDAPFSVFLQEKFGLPPASHPPIFALTLSTQPLGTTTVDFAIPRIARHLSSIGLFGPGFGALLPKWGGLAEIGQVACRACAVGGGVYVLGKGVEDAQPDEELNLRLTLSDGVNVTTKWLAGLQQELAGTVPSLNGTGSIEILTSRSVSVVSSSLTSLFPPTSEGGVTPAGAVILSQSSNHDESPVHIYAHSSESGECPSGQCVLYASVTENHENGYGRLEQAVSSLLQSVGDLPAPRVLWSMRYQQRTVSDSPSPPCNGPVIALQSLCPDLVFDDKVLEDVRSAWQQIVHADPENFLKFEAREGTLGDDADAASV